MSCNQSERISATIRNARKTKSRQERSSRLTLAALLVSSIVLIVLLQMLIDSTDAKKIKIKDLKKVKKYAYLLAGQRKKLYAIPFPVPLPVFVKRQHIYTQVPIVPRYIQQPSNHYSSDSMADPYASMLSYSQKEFDPSYYHPTPSASFHAGETKSSSSPQSKTTSRYISQLANVLSQNYPLQREVITKLLNGQAKIISPSQIKVISILTGLKQQGSKRPQEHHDSTQANSDSSSSSKNNNTTKADPSTDSKGSASSNELYMSQSRHRRPVGLVPSNFYRIPPGLMHTYSPYLTSSHAAPRLPMFHPQLASELMQTLVEPQLIEANDQLESQLASQQDNQDIQAAPNSQDYEFVALNKANPEQLLAVALEKARRQRALEATLIRAKEEQRAAETDSLALHAHQLGLPLIPGPLRLVNY